MIYGLHSELIRPDPNHPLNPFLELLVLDFAWKAANERGAVLSTAPRRLQVLRDCECYGRAGGTVSVIPERPSVVLTVRA